MEFHICDFIYTLVMQWLGDMDFGGDDAKKHIVVHLNEAQKSMRFGSRQLLIRSCNKGLFIDQFDCTFLCLIDIPKQ